MATRVKRVVDPDQVAHLWAHKAQSDARNPGGNIYFNGDTIFSYGSHFPIACHVENSRGESAVLLTTRTYSSTTAGHICAVRSACRHLTVFHVAHPRDDGAVVRREQFEEYRQRQLDLMREYAKAKSRKPRIFTQIGETVEEANEFAKFFGLRSRLKLPPNTAGIVAECERIAKAERDRKRREDSKRKRKAEANLAKWVNGETTYGNFYGFPVCLRIKDDELQTSLGARVPLAEAIRVYKILKRLRSRAKTYHRNGETIQLGQFALDSMDETGNVSVGCHTVAWDEVARVAKLAGL